MLETNFDSRLFAELYDFHPQAIVWMRPVFSEDGSTIVDFEYNYCNDEGLNYLNLTREQFSGLRVTTSPTLPEESRRVVLEEMTGVFTTGKRSETSLYNAALNKYARVLRARLRDGVVSVIQDVTKENRIIHQLEQQTNRLEEQTRELHEQKTLLNNILQNSSNGISVSKVFRDDSGKVVDALTIMANDSAVKYIGLPRDIYLSKRATEIEPSIMGSPYYLACIKTLDTGEPFVMQYQMESTHRWLELSVSRLDRDHLIQIFTDVTPIKQVHLQLEKAADTLRTVFDSAQTGMFTLAPEFNDKGAIVDFRFVMVNSTLSTYIGSASHQIQDQLVSEWFPGYQQDGIFDMYKNCFEVGFAGRMEFHDKSKNHDNYLDLQCTKIDDQLLVTFTDHTTLRKSQLDLEQTVKALEQSNTNLEDFAHAASHDMKEPLRKILTYTDRLKTSLAPRMTEMEIRLCDRVVTAAERMQMLVDDLLEFSHVSEMPKDLEAIDLNEKVKKVVTDLELPLEEKGGKVIVHSLPTIMGNRRQLQQLFHNLISNALKYSKEDLSPVVTISSKTVRGAETRIDLPIDSRDKLFHLIQVSDNGIGFEQKYADLIFKMFQRLHGRSEFSGTGVGLSIARKVVQNHNGYIWAESEVSHGATFYILFPHQ